MIRGRNKTTPPWSVAVANGVNLDLLGRREQDIYGKCTLADIERELTQWAKDLGKLWQIDLRLTFFQSNDECAYLEFLSRSWDFALVNAGAWSHTSLALADRLAGLQLPFVEVHISNLAKRDPMRQKSLLAPLAQGVVYGMGSDSYRAGILRAASVLQGK